MKFNDHEEVFSTSGQRKKRGTLAGLLAHLNRERAEQAADDEDDTGEAAASEKLEDYFGEGAKNAPRGEEPHKPKFDLSSLTRNRLTLGILCILAAFLIGFVFVPLSAHLASIETVTVLRAAQDIRMGAQLTPEMLEEVEVSAQNLPETVVTVPEQAVGKFAAMDIAQDENILSTKLTDVQPIGEEYLSTLPNGDLAVSVSVKSFASGLSGKLLPGDVVSVYANLANNPNQYDYRSSLVSELYYIEVLAVTNEEVGDTDDFEPDPENPDADTLPSTVTLRCINLEQARVLTGLEANSAIHLALICRGDEAYKKQLLDSQAQYFILLALQQQKLAEEQAAASSEESNDSSQEDDSSSEEAGA